MPCFPPQYCAPALSIFRLKMYYFLYSESWSIFFSLFFLTNFLRFSWRLLISEWPFSILIQDLSHVLFFIFLIEISFYFLVNFWICKWLVNSSFSINSEFRVSLFRASSLWILPSLDWWMFFSNPNFKINSGFWVMFRSSAYSSIQVVFDFLAKFGLTNSSFLHQNFCLLISNLKLCFLPIFRLLFFDFRIDSKLIILFYLNS